MVQAGELTPLFAGIIDINWDSALQNTIVLLVLR